MIGVEYSQRMREVATTTENDLLSEYAQYQTVIDRVTRPVLTLTRAELVSELCKVYDVLEDIDELRDKLGQAISKFRVGT